MDRRKLRAVTLPKRSRGRRLLELGKDALIVFLILSALYLAARSQLYTGLAGDGTLFAQVAGLLHPTPDSPGSESSPGVAGEAVPAVRLAICHGTGDNGLPIRYGVQYDDETLEPIAAALSRYFTEGLASAGTPEELTAAQWQEVLQAPGVCLDLLGAVPLDYLGADTLTQSARRLALVWDGSSPTASLCYQTEEGEVYRCTTTVNWKGYLSDALQGYTDNGARYAFEMDEAVYGHLAPEVLLLSQTPQSPIYQAARPLDLNTPADRSALENAMGFRGSDYQVPGEWVIREDDELRIAFDGTMHYESAGSRVEGRYPTSAVEGAADRSGAIAASYQLAQEALSAWCGSVESAARLVLSGVTETDTGWQITLDYALNGALVLFEDGGPAMEFTAENGQITAFTIRPRCYQATEHVSVLLREPLAAAALESLRPREHSELLLFYEDSMNAMSAQWGGF